MYRPLAAISAARVQRRGRHQRDPQPAVGAEALLRREVVHVGLADVHRQAARPAGRVHDHQRARVGPGHPADGHGHAGGGLVVGQRVGVHARLRRAAAGGCRAASRSRVGSSSHGRARGHLRELRRELAERQVLRSLAGPARTPRSPRTPWCRRCPAPPGSRRAGRTARPGPRGPAAPASGPGPGGARCPGRWRRTRPARRPARDGPWTARSRTGRRRACSPPGCAMRRSPPSALSAALAAEPGPGRRGWPGRSPETRGQTLVQDVGGAGHVADRAGLRAHVAGARAGPGARSASAPGCARPSRRSARR